MRNSNIPGLSHYHIRRDGKLLSNFSGKWREVKPVIKSTGYVSNNLIADDGKRYNYYRHRLVALVWIPNEQNKPCVCHRDNNPQNNHYSNLYWGEQEENISQCIRDKRFYSVGIEKSKKLKERVNSSEVVKDYKEGIPRKDILSKYQISVGYLYKILRQHNVKLRKI